MNREKIVAQELSIGYKEGKRKNKTLHSNLSFTVNSGELTTIMGVNGAGKSTLIKSICGIIPPISGTITISGKNIKDISQSQMSKHISIVLTERVADGGLTGYEVISLGRYHHTGFFGKIAQKDRESIEHAIAIMSIDDLRNKQIANMSDGERQKIMIAKSLCQQSDIIILDEPTAFLDIRSRIDIMQLLQKCAKEEQRAILISSHDLEQSIEYSDNLWILTKTEGLFCNSTYDTIRNGSLEKVLGNNSEQYLDYIESIKKRILNR